MHICLAVEIWSGFSHSEVAMMLQNTCKPPYKQIISRHVVVQVQKNYFSDLATYAYYAYSWLFQLNRQMKHECCQECIMQFCDIYTALYNHCTFDQEALNNCIRTSMYDALI